MLLTVWSATRALLMLFVLKVLTLPGPDVTTDVSVIYQGWYEVLRTGSFPLDDVTWQYPPGAAVPVLAPGMLPFLPYPTAFFVLALLTDAVVTLLLARAGRRPGRRRAGAWTWVVGLPLLGPTAYARYDLMVTALAVAALLVPRLRGPLIGLGALVKVWPVLLLTGVRARSVWVSAGVTAAAVLAAFTLLMPGALAFLAFQRDRGTEVESLGALVFHVARHFGWEGEVMMNYGSVEFLGPYVPLVSRASLALTLLSFAWLLWWRFRARAFGPHTMADAAFAAVLLFTVTSRVISPQYMLWLVGLAAVCLTLRSSRMEPAARVVLAATLATLLEFPLGFSHVVHSDALGITVLLIRNALLVTATALACRALWRDTVPSGSRPARAHV
ncbi:glycosyltransferase 87 family protein [Streptomyces sp. NPDC101132]|uniref:glycosyltransferase 87 family protein n=1 Tax=Streptomyces sp. NPDC101132 TaxID=3366110 RepID=UPI0037FA72A9